MPTRLKNVEALELVVERLGVNEPSKTLLRLARGSVGEARRIDTELVHSQRPTRSLVSLQTQEPELERTLSASV